MSFQYISCYCLSLSVFNASSVNQDFNTSHVTVYQSRALARVLESSDFNTSHVTVYRMNFAQKRKKWEYFNTSHVTVYQRMEKDSLSDLRISIHLMLLFIACSSLYYGTDTRISIHLMLLFITSDVNDNVLPKLFQYISCYCLSNPAVYNIAHIHISIHLMLLFIHTCPVSF